MIEPDTDDPETVFVCFEWEPPRGSHYHATGEWRLCGVVSDEQDAELFLGDEGEDHEERKYEELLLNMVQPFYTQHYDR